MGRKLLEVAVEPEVLLWARESMGFGVKDVAHKMKAAESTIIKLESGQKKPTVTQLERLAEVYKRPLAAFFLPRPPREQPMPKDFRSLPEDRKAPLSAETRLAMRRARRLQSLATELTGGLERQIDVKIGGIDLSKDPEVVAVETRRQLRVEVHTQFHWKDEYVAFSEWKKVIERCGIFVFQLSMALEDGIRGFSVIEGGYPAIVLNLRDKTRGRIFSLFHEYGHLALNHSGICDMGDQEHLHGEGRKVEIFCNHLAGAILVPRDALLSQDVIESRKYSRDWPDKALNKLANRFKVSREVILRRLVLLELADRNFYKRKREEWQETELAKEEKRGKIRRNPPRECIRNNGAPFVSLVLESHRRERITYRDVADYLDVGLKHLPAVEQHIRGKA